MMYARVTTGQAAPEKLTEGIQHYREQVLPVLQEVDGFRGVYSLADPKSGKVMVVALWETETAMEASGQAAASLRSQSAEAFGTTGELTVESFEVLLQPNETEGERLASAVAAAARELEGQVRRVASSEEVSKLSRQVESSLRSFA